MSEYIVLIVENEKIKMDKKTAFKSQTLKQMIELSEEGEIPEIPINDISKKVILKIIEFYEIYKNEVEPVPEKDSDGKLKKITYKFKNSDRDFVNQLTANETYHLVMGLNFLSFGKFLDLACWKAAEEIRGRSPEDIKKNFGIEKEYEKEEWDEEMKV
jgi:S-phase kinase-associated protein 1